MRAPLLVLLVSMTLAGCAGGTAEPAASQAPTTSETASSTAEPEPAPSSSTAEPAPEPEPAETDAPLDGMAAVHERINALTDCAALQDEFDTADANFAREQAGTPQANASLAYMTTADARMQEVGCY